jgi:hypothetical protein
MEAMIIDINFKWIWNSHHLYLNAMNIPWKTRKSNLFLSSSWCTWQQRLLFFSLPIKPLDSICSISCGPFHGELLPVSAQCLPVLLTNCKWQSWDWALIAQKQISYLVKQDEVNVGHLWPGQQGCL